MKKITITWDKEMLIYINWERLKTIGKIDVTKEWTCTFNLITDKICK